MKKVFLLLCLFLLFGCSNKSELKEGIDSDILLLNYKNVNRRSIAEAIERLEKCSPKIIAINALFLGRKEGDSLLSEALKKSGKVILVSKLQGGSLLSSEKDIAEKSLSDGLLDYEFNEDRVVGYKAFKSVDSKLIWSFPVTVAIHYNPEKGAEMLREMKANYYYPLELNRSINNYHVLDIESPDFDCSLVNNKIVLMGYLDEDDTDKIQIKQSQGTDKVHSTLVVAIIISNLLEEYRFN